MVSSEACKIASGLAETLAPFHDLSDPEHSIAYIAKNLSGCEVGDAATELGLARMTDPRLAERPEAGLL